MNYILSKSDRKNKKLMIITPQGVGTTKASVAQGHKIHFGAYGYSDYILSKNIDKKNAYIARHKVNEDWTKNGINTAGFWSRWLLWNEPNLNDSIRDVEKRFNINIIKK